MFRYVEILYIPIFSYTIHISQRIDTCVLFSFFGIIYRRMWHILMHTEVMAVPSVNLVLKDSTYIDFMDKPLKSKCYCCILSVYLLLN